MNKLINKAIFVLAIILIFGKLIFKSRESITDKKIDNVIEFDINNNNPSKANKKNLNNLLIVKEEYILSYNCSKGIANWVGWRTSQEDLGDLSRSDDFREDQSLPKNCYQVDENDYRGSGYDRGHLIPSGDRTRTKSDNSSTFLMTNMLPQHPSNNREVWRDLETYSRELVNQGLKLYSFAGGNGELKRINKGKISVPKYT